MTEARARETAAHVSENERASVAQGLEIQRRREQSKRLTVEEFGKQWTSGELYKKHGEVNKLRPKATADDDAYRLTKYVYPRIGKKQVADVTEADIEYVLNEASRKQGPQWRAKLHVYQAMHRLFDLAVMPGRIRKDNPVSRYLRPGKTKPILFTYLYPAELLMLLHCPNVPVARRVLYALAVYTGLRKGSLYALTWGGVDFKNRTLTSLESKTDLPQMFEIHANLSKLLARWYEYQGRPKSDARIVVTTEVERRGEREGETLREDMTAAKVKRQALHERKPNTSPMRFHDLRATFVTWAMREGRGDGWISDRTGHLTPEMRSRYARAARTLQDLKYVPFPDISKAIPELLERRENVVSIRAAKGRRSS